MCRKGRILFESDNFLDVGPVYAASAGKHTLDHRCLLLVSGGFAQPGIEPIRCCINN
jgi:hypothetical protein